MPCYPEFKAHSFSSDKEGSPCDCGKFVMPSAKVLEERTVAKMTAEQRQKYLTDRDTADRLIDRLTPEERQKYIAYREETLSFKDPK